MGIMENKMETTIPGPKPTTYYYASLRLHPRIDSTERDEYCVQDRPPFTADIK